ncbi:MAG: OmpA family protein [Fusobacteriaceae bacterium]|nr:OmpA family protein [Fusobacteriaceae bacterium]
MVELINDQLRFLLPGGLSFDSGSAVIKEDFKKSLDAISVVLNKYPETLIFVTGYTDNTGSSAGNKKLSEERAASVKEYMITKEVEAGRFYTEGYGELHPIADNATDEGKAQNRRVEIRVLTAY